MELVSIQERDSIGESLTSGLWSFKGACHSNHYTVHLFPTPISPQHFCDSEIHCAESSQRDIEFSLGLHWKKKKTLAQKSQQSERTKDSFTQSHKSCTCIWMYKGKQEEFKMCLSFLPSEESGRKAGICLCWWAVFSSGRFALDVSSEWQSLEMACYWMSSPIHRSSLEPVQQLTDLLRTENYQHELWQHLNIAVITGISSEDRRRRKGNGAQQVVNCQTLSMITWSWNDTFIQKQRKKHTGKPNHARAKPISKQKKSRERQQPWL